MTMERRREIFAKEVLTIADVQELYCMNYQSASKFLRDLKCKLIIGMSQELRIKIEGKIHIEDYKDALGIKSDNLRYAIVMIGGAENEDMKN